MSTDASVCGDTVRRHDPDRFLLSLLARADVREDLWALYAFNHEIAKTREVVTETQLGLIRLQWWRDAIAAIYAAGAPVPEHPIIHALQKAIYKHGLTQERLDALIYAREFDLEDRLPANMQGMIYYADYTMTPLLELSCVMAAPQSKADIEDIAVGYALAGLLRATPTHLSQRRCYLPADRLPMIHRHYEGKELEALIPVVPDVVAEAKARLAKPATGLPRIARGHRKLALMYLKQIEKAGFNLFAPALRVPPVFKELRVFFA